MTSLEPFLMQDSDTDYGADDLVHGVTIREGLDPENQQDGVKRYCAALTLHLRRQSLVSLAAKLLTAAQSSNQWATVSITGTIELTQRDSQNYSPVESTATLDRDAAIALLEEALQRLKLPTKNANGGSVQLGGVYWRLAKVLRDHVDRLLDNEEGEEHARNLRCVHGTVVRRPSC